jgi:hypothetical protein
MFLITEVYKAHMRKHVAFPFNRFYSNLNTLQLETAR